MNQPTNEHDSSEPNPIPLQMEAGLSAPGEGDATQEPGVAESQEKYPEEKDIKGGIDFVRPCHGGRRFYFKDGSVAVLMDDGITVYEHVSTLFDKLERMRRMEAQIERWKELKKWTPRSLDQL